MMTFHFGCGGDPYKGQYAKTKPTPQTFVGDWTLRTGSPGSNPANPTRLTLQADGRFRVLNYPGEALGSFGNPGTLLDGGGTWAVQPHQNFWVVGINWQKLGSKQLDYGQMLHILSDKPPHVLHHIIGDPDSGQALVFEKTK